MKKKYIYKDNEYYKYEIKELFYLINLSTITGFD